MKKSILLTLAAATAFATTSLAQLNKSIKISEVLTSNTTSLQDEYGNRHAWVEIANDSYSTYNIRGMYVTTNRAVLNENLTAPQRMEMMSKLPNGDDKTAMGGQQRVLYYLGSEPTLGFRHLNAKVEPGQPLWIAIYNGNAMELIDSVSVPALAENESYALTKVGTETVWKKMQPGFVTPWTPNTYGVKQTKADRLKQDDPYGLGITVLAMGIVFFCLALLFVFFWGFGLIMRNQKRVKKVARIQPIKAGVKVVNKTVEAGHITNNLLQDGLKTKGIDKEVYIAVISMALHEYQNDIHDVESGVITIRPRQTPWNTPFGGND